MADFTEIYKHSSSSLCKYAPSGAYIATAIQYRLVIRDAETLQILQIFSCMDTIQELEWAPDSNLILCACGIQRGNSVGGGIIQVWKLDDEKWSARIEEGVVGCVGVKWSPDSRHILSFSDFSLRVTVYSLIDKSLLYLQYPKFSDRGYCFRKDGKYFAMAQRIECKDYLCIFNTEDWEMVKRWPVASTDLEGISWSPDGRFIAVWEPCTEYKLYIYYPDGRLVTTYTAYEEALGLKTASWSPSSQFLALGSYDQKLRLLNYYTWKPLVEMSHPQNLTGEGLNVFRETDITDQKEFALAHGNDGNLRAKLRYELVPTPVTLSQVKPSPEKPLPKLGVGLVSFSCNGRFMLTRNDNMPTALWIWDVMEVRQIALIQQLSPVREATWSPLHPGRLAYVCGNGYLYLWEAELGCESIEIPAVNFKVNSFSWNPDGKSLALMDSDKFCLAFPIDE